MNKRAKEWNRINNQLDEQVYGENEAVMTNLVCYLRAANISAYQQEVVRHDLLEMVLSAQNRGERIESVIGEDYQEFCDNIIANLPPRSLKERVLEFLDTFVFCASILGLIKILFSKNTILLIKNFFTGEALNFQIAVSAADVILFGSILAAAFLIVHFICRNSFRPERTRNKVLAFLMGTAVMTGMLFLLWVGRNTLFTVHLFALAAFVAALYVAHLLLERVV